MNTRKRENLEETLPEVGCLGFEWVHTLCVLVVIGAKPAVNDLKKKCGSTHDAQRVLELDTLWGYVVWGCARNWRTIELADGCPTPAAQHTGGPCGNPPPMLSCSTGGHRQHSSAPRRRGRRRNGFPFSNASKLLWLPRERGDSPTSTHTCCGPLLA